MWNDRYAEEAFAYGKEPNDFVCEVAAALPAGGRILCIAEGQGRNAVFLAERGFDVTAMDLSDVGMNRARELAAERGVRIETVVADLDGYDLGEELWDGVVAIFAHMPPSLRAVVHRGIVRALEPGGAVILEAYTPEQLNHRTGGPPVMDLLMCPETLRAEFDGLEFELLRDGERHISEGKYHEGISHTVQLLGRKP